MAIPLGIAIFFLDMGLSISIVILSPYLADLSITFQGAKSSDVVNPYVRVDLAP
jgi:hypothetical protein